MTVMNAMANFSTKSEAARLSKMSQTDAAQILVFQLGEHDYGIDIRQVRRCRSYQSLARVANGPDMVEGVAISDGVVLPIVDLRLAADIARPIFNHLTAVIILNVMDRAIGLVVDNASDVIGLTAGDVKPACNAGLAPTLQHGCLEGIATYEGRRLMLLDAKKLLHHTDIAEPKNEA